MRAHYLLDQNFSLYFHLQYLRNILYEYMMGKETKVSVL